MMLSNKNKTILMLGNSKLVIFGFRGELIQKLIADGHRVVVAFPNGPFGEGKEISEKFGCEFVEIQVDRRGTNPLNDLKLIFDYIKLVRQVNPNIVLAYTVKCDVYGGLVCRLMNKSFIPNVTGLGKGLAEGGLIGIFTRELYKLAVRKAKCIFFQNTQDKQYFDDNGIKYQKGYVIPGSGVNLTIYKSLPYPDDNKIIFTYIARVMRSKGIEEFLSAAQVLKKKYNNVEFHICGFCEENYESRIQELSDAGIIVYHGLVQNMTEIENISHCIVLPSFHPEGISNVLLEGAASARPLITTDRAGCRETVNDCESGFLVRERDSIDLIDKMEQFLYMSNDERKEMGLKGRKKMEQQFDRNIVVEKYCEVIDELY